MILWMESDTTNYSTFGLTLNWMGHHGNKLYGVFPSTINLNITLFRHPTTCQTYCRFRIIYKYIWFISCLFLLFTYLSCSHHTLRDLVIPHNGVFGLICLILWLGFHILQHWAPTFCVVCLLISQKRHQLSSMWRNSPSLHRVEMI